VDCKVYLCINCSFQYRLSDEEKNKITSEEAPSKQTWDATVTYVFHYNVISEKLDVYSFEDMIDAEWYFGSMKEREEAVFLQNKHL
jgi:hypothetical protein